MTTVTVTEFQKDLAGYIAKVKNGETLELVPEGECVAEVAPLPHEETVPAWKRPGLQLKIEGAKLSEAIIEERRESAR